MALAKAPTPNPASRKLPGTARIASAEVMMTMGNTKMAIVSPAVISVGPPVN